MTTDLASRTTHPLETTAAAFGSGAMAWLSVIPVTLATMLFACIWIATHAH